jgi:hypothetical protein
MELLNTELEHITQLKSKETTTNGIHSHEHKHLMVIDSIQLLFHSCANLISVTVTKESMSIKVTLILDRYGLKTKGNVTLMTTLNGLKELSFLQDTLALLLRSLTAMDSDLTKTRYEETQVLIKEDVDNAKNLKLPTIENQL